MKNDGRFAGTRPAMAAFVEGSPPVLWLQAHLDQPHVVIFFEAVEGQHRSQDGCCFDTDEDSSMYPLGDHGPVGCDDEKIHRMLVYLADECWGSDRKHKRFWRHAFVGKMFQA